jgi:alpha-glucoside transport system permease protein
MTSVIPTTAHAPTAKSTAVAATRTATAADPGKRRIVLTIVLGIVAVLWMLPVIGLLITAFRSRVDATSTGWWTVLVDPFGQGWTLDNFAEAFFSLDIGTNFFNSMAVTLPATILPIMFAAFAAYALTFLDFKGKEVMFAIIIGLLVVPIQVALVPILQAYVQIQNAIGIQIVGTFPAAWIVHSAFALPLATFILRNYMATLPVSLIEAARVDGASQFRTFLTVGIPAARPAMAILGLFTFMTAWTDYLWPLIVLSPSNPTLQTALSQLQSGYYIDYSIVLTGAVMATIPLLVLFIVAGKQLISGIMAGAVKG